jgi:hypothetical protein
MYIRVVANYKFSSYWSLMLRLFYFRNFWVIWVLVLVPVFGIASSITLSNYPHRIETGTLFTAWLLLFPAIIYYNSRKKFYSNGKLSNPVVFEITEEKLTITTTSSNSSRRWDDGSYLIQGTKNWLIVYKVINNRKIPLEIIPRELFTIEQLKEIQQAVVSAKISWTRWLPTIIIILIIIILNVFMLFL